MKRLPGKFVWFEHLSNDIPAARRFYEGLFGWHTEMTPTGDDRYAMIMAGNDGVGGYSQADAGSAPHWRAYMSVADVDASHRLALAAGAREVMAPTDFGGFGRGAVITDPGGAEIALWTSTHDDQPDVALAPDGHFCWNELMTPDARRALAFYESVFGYGHDAMDMGPQGIYYILKRDGQQRGGLMQCPEAGMPALWTPYVVVADAEASAAKAQALGGKLVMPLMDVPDVGRIGMLTDPLGASVAFLRPQPQSA